MVWSLTYLLGLLGIVGLSWVLRLLSVSFGTGYGTLFMPIFLLLNVPLETAMPGILFSQLVSSGVAIWTHHTWENLHVFNDWKNGSRKESLFVLTLMLVGLVFGFLPGQLPIQFSRKTLSIVVALTIITIGFLGLQKVRRRYSKGNMLALVSVAGIVKGFTGTGIGPLMTGGQIVLGNNLKAAGITTLVELPICLAAFVSYCAKKNIENLPMIGCMCLGAVLAGIFGGRVTARFKHHDHVGSLILIGVGLFTLGAVLFRN